MTLKTSGISAIAILLFTFGGYWWWNYPSCSTIDKRSYSGDVLRGIGLLERGEPDEARLVLQEALEHRVSRLNPRIHEMVALASEDLGRVDEAIAHYTRAAELANRYGCLFPSEGVRDAFVRMQQVRITALRATSSE